MPILSIIIPVYNTEIFLEECIESIINNSNNFFNDIEIIVVNDCSPNYELLSDIVSKYKNIKFINHDINKGLYQSRLTGIKNANGKYIMHLDSDDYLYNNILEYICNIISNYNYDIIFYGMILMYEESKKFHSDDWYSIPLYDMENNTEIMNYFYAGYNHTMCGKVYNKEMINKCFNDFPNIDKLISFEDVFQNIIISKFANTSYSIQKIGYIYRQNSNSNTLKKKIDEASRLKLKYEVNSILISWDNFFRKYDIYKHYKNDIIHLFFYIIKNSYNISHENNYNDISYNEKLEYISNFLDINIKDHLLSLFLDNINYVPKKQKDKFHLFNIKKSINFTILYIFGIKISIKKKKIF